MRNYILDNDRPLLVFNAGRDKILVLNVYQVIGL